MDRIRLLFAVALHVRLMSDSHRHLFALPVPKRRSTDHLLALIALCAVCAVMIFFAWNNRFALIDAFVGAPQPALAMTLPICGSGPRISCVVDGDTIWLDGEKMRLERIDTPELFSPSCPSERVLAQQARDSLVSLLASKPWQVTRGDPDRFGRTLVSLRNDDGWIGDQLVDQGLARPWNGARAAWC